MKILVVEDERDLNRIITKHLKKNNIVLIVVLMVKKHWILLVIVNMI